MYLLGMRRMTASSRSKGLFEAPRTTILWLSLEVNPSQADINSFRRIQCKYATAFTSSTKIIVGANLTAKENSALTNVRDEGVTLMKWAPASVARAFAIRVFPVPGGPKSSIPLQG
ncbi:cell division control protein 48 [Striga asiatica]|uniref:Cell division control protein 48 n=1 Tax=Striga asiatica TaxID=4170 RepID=A0A5A7RA50_STRAF|nr:cell division control protein 48 [Striga asiatica]